MQTGYGRRRQYSTDLLERPSTFAFPAKVPGDVNEKVEDDEPAHAEDVVEEDTSSESEDDMPSFPVLRSRPVPATRPIPAP